MAFNIKLPHVHILSAVPELYESIISSNVTRKIISQTTFSKNFKDILNHLPKKHSRVLLIDDFPFYEDDLLKFIYPLPDKFPLTKTILFTGSTNDGFLKSCLRYGVKGLVHKKENSLAKATETILKTIEIVNHGFVCIDKVIDTEIFRYVWAKGNDNILFENKSKNDELLKLLTPREKEIIKQLTLGKQNKEIAEELYISVDTVEQHKNHIRQKLNLKSASEILKFALENKYYF